MYGFVAQLEVVCVACIRLLGLPIIFGIPLPLLFLLLIIYFFLFWISDFIMNASTILLPAALSESHNGSSNSFVKYIFKYGLNLNAPRFQAIKLAGDHLSM